MEREIKFRGFDQDESMYYDVAVSNGSWSPSVIEDEWRGGGLMQFTGLLDRNKKEIYEGDILQRWQEHRISHYVNRSGLILVQWVHSRTRLGFNIATGENVEVVGNMYENPELLQKVGQRV